jgi:signal transduction histidine kinase
MKVTPKSIPLETSRWLRLAHILWYAAAAVALGIFITALSRNFYGLPSRFLDRFLFPPDSNWKFALNLASVVASNAAALLSLGLAWMLHHQKPGDRMSVFLSYFLLYYGVVFAGPLETLASHWPIVASTVVPILDPFFYPLFLSLILLFPDGRFVPTWTRWMVLITLPILPISYIFDYSIQAVTSGPLLWVGIFVFSATALIAFYATIYRYRLVSNSIERQQTKWVVYGLLMMLLISVLTVPPYFQLLMLPPGSPFPWWGVITSLIYSFSLTILPICLAIAVLHYRLYDIDILINRTLVYGALTGITIGIYIFIVGYLGNLLQTFNQTVLAFLATGLVALSFQPLRERLQAGINHLMFGERDDPVAVLSSLSKRVEASLEPEASLTGIVETVGQALKLPYVAIEIFNGQTSKIVAEFGNMVESTEYLPLIHQSKTIGQMAFAHRSPNENFSKSEVKLLRNISRQTGAAVYSAKLTADLRRSRQNLVTAREEERRRLRRDLHDELSPTLAGVTLRIDTARNFLENNPERAEMVLVETKGQIQNTISDIRHLVYDLRPPALDEMGLSQAVRSIIEQQKLDGLKFTFEEPDPLPYLSAAVEVAAYRIATEGITNVIRHAHASNAAIRIYYENGNLIVEIADNGIGIPEPLPTGVGFTSMRTRAEELGGALQHKLLSPGTLLRACLPCAEEQSWTAELP